MASSLRLLSCLATFAVSACQAPAARNADSDAIPDHRGGALTTPPPLRDANEPQPSSREIPIDADDGVWGDALAPVTVVVFTDLQCPYCAEGHASLTAMQRKYGESRLRVVLKHTPLARHAYAIPAARTAQAVLELGGRRKFFRYVDLAYSRPDAIAEGAVLELAAPLELDPEQLRARATSAEIGEQVLRDALLAERLAILATPHYRINGLGLTGVQRESVLSSSVEAELREVAGLRRRGVAPNSVYQERVSMNLSKPEN